MKLSLKSIEPYAIIILFISIALYIVSLKLPGFVVLTPSKTYEVQTGYQILTEGWGGVMIGMFAWCANLFFFICLFFAVSKRHKEGLNCAILGFIIGLQSFFFHTTHNGEVDHLSIGYYIWELSFIFLSLYFYLKLKNSRGIKTNETNTRKTTVISIFAVTGIVIGIICLISFFAWSVYIKNF